MRYYSCVVAYNGAAMPSEQPTCTDGATYDPSPPELTAVVDGDGAPFQSGSPCTSWSGLQDGGSAVVQLTLQLTLVEADLETPLGSAVVVASPPAAGSSC